METNVESLQRIFITRSDEAKFCSNWVAFFQKGSMNLKEFNPQEMNLHDFFKKIFDEGLNEDEPTFVTQTIANSHLSFHFFPLDTVYKQESRIIKQIDNTNFVDSAPSLGIYLDHNLLSPTESVHFLGNIIEKLRGKVENFYLLTNDLGLNSTLNIAKMVKSSTKNPQISLFH